MHLLAENSTECEFLLEVLGAHFGVWRELEKQYEDSDSERHAVVLGLQQVGNILDQIYGYQESYPETKGTYFYTELGFDQAERLLQSFDVFIRIKKNKLAYDQQRLLNKYRSQVEAFVRDFSPEKLDETYVKDLFEEYQRELQAYCELAISDHINNGNEAVYVFALQYFPGHHYQLATMNTLRAMYQMSQGNAVSEAAAQGFDSEFYNPACFDVECSTPDTYSAIEQRIRQLYMQFFYLTNEYGERSYQQGSPEYKKIKQLSTLCDNLFIETSIKVLNQVDFSGLNRADIFCAIIASHELSAEEFYRYAKQTVAQEKFSQIFPNADRVEKDYVDLKNASAQAAVQYMVNYIKDFHRAEVPAGRYYTQNKVYEYIVRLCQYPRLADDEVLSILEEVVEQAKPNPNNGNEQCFISMFSSEGKLFSDLLRVLAGFDEFAAGTQQRLIHMYQKVTSGMQASINYPSFAHRDLAIAIAKTDPDKYPALEYDTETNYLKNIDDYLK